MFKWNFFSFTLLLYFWYRYNYETCISLIFLIVDNSYRNLFVVSCFFFFIDCQNLFGIIYRCPQEMKETLLMFRLVGEDVNKSEWLQNLTAELANTTCTADTVRTGH